MCIVAKQKHFNTEKVLKIVLKKKTAKNEQACKTYKNIHNVIM